MTLLWIQNDNDGEYHLLSDVWDVIKLWTGVLRSLKTIHAIAQSFFYVGRWLVTSFIIRSWQYRESQLINSFLIKQPSHQPKARGTLMCILLHDTLIYKEI